MKKHFSTLLFFSAAIFSVKAQNIQLHYDFGRNAATTTVEMFRADNAGSTLFFVDMDYTPKVSGAYFEISRELCFWQESALGWLSAHIEYNGGLDTVAGSYNNAWLGGVTYSGHYADWSKTWSLSARYPHRNDQLRAHQPLLRQVKETDTDDVYTGSTLHTEIHIHLDGIQHRIKS